MKKEKQNKKRRKGEKINCRYDYILRPKYHSISTCVSVMFKESLNEKLFTHTIDRSIVKLKSVIPTIFKEWFYTFWITFSKSFLVVNTLSFFLKTAERKESSSKLTTGGGWSSSATVTQKPALNLLSGDR